MNKYNSKQNNKKSNTKNKVGVVNKSRAKFDNSDNSKNKLKITKDTLLAELLMYPELYETLYKLGVPCIACPLAGFEANFLTLEAVANTYGLDLEKLIKELNEKAKQIDVKQNES